MEGYASIAVAFIAGLVVSFFLIQTIFNMKLKNAEEKSKDIIEKANKESETLKKEAEIDIKNRNIELRTEMETKFKKETEEKTYELKQQEKRLIQRESKMDKRLDALEKKEKTISEKEQKITNSEKKIEKLEKDLLKELETVSHLTREEAQKRIITELEKELSYEMAVKIRKSEELAKYDSEKKAKSIIAHAIQKYSVEHVSDTTVSVVNLPNDDMKGRIIGREGRNIRTLESLTGINIIIDDTPEAVVLSGFNSINREIARIALEKLIADGRIHPARIEEMVEKAQAELKQHIKETGEQVLLELGLTGIDNQIVELIGRLEFRTSYGQNVLQHSIEVAKIAAAMAAEIGANVMLAKRAGILHDIGKAIDSEVEGTHAAIGADIAKKCKENPKIVNAIAAHHEDEEPQTVEAVLIAASDAISASRTGARRESIDAYVKRLEGLEGAAKVFDGVKEAYAIQAGREIRVIVDSENINDALASKTARDISKKIEDEMEYPGEIKVVVVRETRAVEYAK